MDLLEQFSNVRFYLLGSYPQGDLGGLLLNITLAVVTISSSFIFGVMLGYSRLSCRIYIKLPSIAYIELIRSTPLIMLIFWFYFFLPYLLGGGHISFLERRNLSLGICRCLSGRDSQGRYHSSAQWPAGSGISKWNVKISGYEVCHIASGI